MSAINQTSVRFERSREILAQAPGTRVSTSLDTNGVGVAANSREAQMRQAAEAFEAVFLRQLIGSMRQAKLGDELFGSAGTEQFRDIADANLADSMAEQGSFGIADLLMQQFRAVVRRVDQSAAPASHNTGNQGDVS